MSIVMLAGVLVAAWGSQPAKPVPLFKWECTDCRGEADPVIIAVVVLLVLVPIVLAWHSGGRDRD
jgi:hypothetical protein